MSRGFVKEDDQEEVPIVPQRAYLPAGVPNFVTPAGMAQLLAEKDGLIAERENPGAINDNEKRIAVNFINARLQLLNNRIAEARIVNLKEQPEDEIRFGATITLKSVAKGLVRTFQIVGVDEADIAKGKIPFISPVSKTLINKKTGNRVTLKQGGEDIEYEITGIAYL
jgi:transcription elongation factor GreB